MTHGPVAFLALVVAAATSLGAARRAGADEGPRDVPVAGVLVLDGRVDEAAWASATLLPCAAMDVPDLGAANGLRTVKPVVRLLRDDTWLWIGVEVDEAPGAGIGLHAFLAGPSANGAADAWGFTYRPVELRADRLVAIAPVASAREALPVEAARDIAQAARWTLEARVPLAPVDADPHAPRRVGLAVLSRSPNVFADAPEEAFARGPAAWLSIAAPEGGWRPPVVEPGAFDAEARAERARRAAFAAWLNVQFASSEADLRPEHREASRIAARAWFEQPLHALEAVRPDLAVPIAVARGDLLERLGRLEEAAAAYAAALAISPGWHEARFGRDVRVAARRALAIDPGGPTDAGVRDARVDAVAAEAGDDPWKALGAALAQAERAAARGDFGEADALIRPLRERFPGDGWIAQLADRVALERREEAGERRMRVVASDDPNTPPPTWAPRPRVRIATPHGPVLVELFEDDAREAVAQWMWLVAEGFYDGLAVHHTLPFRWVLGGDPGTAEGASDDAVAAIGAGGPGFAVESADSPRRPWRGSLALERPDEGLVGSRFALLTGTASEASDALVVIGHVLEGMDAVDALRRGDRLGPFTIESARPGSIYRPIGRDGRPAPRPVR